MPVDVDPLSENSHSIAVQGGEITDLIARTRQISTFAVNHDNVRVFWEGAGSRAERGITQKRVSRKIP